MTELRFTVWGHAATKGAVRPVPVFKKGADGTKIIVGSRLTEDSKRSRPWQAVVRDAAREAVGSDAIAFPAETAVSIHAVFWLPAPKSIPKRRPSAPLGMRAGDCDKLLRGLLDPLMNVVFADDGQVVEARAIKAYVVPGTMPRVDVLIRAVDLNAWPWCQSIGVRAAAAPEAVSGELFAEAMAR